VVLLAVAVFVAFSAPAFVVVFAAPSMSAASTIAPLGLILKRFIVKFWILLFTTSRLQFPPTIVPKYFE
jgi:hypothetical protein